jgi:phosphoribosylamine--glycine ligase
VRKDGTYYTCSGRVLSVCATGDSIAAARDRAYNAVGHIHFRGAHYRTDIGASAVQDSMAPAAHSAIPSYKVD